MSEWIPVTERLPEDDELVIVNIPNDTRLAVFYSFNTRFEEHMTGAELYPSHWYPIPKDTKRSYGRRIPEDAVIYLNI